MTSNEWTLINIPPEITLHILSYLDIPDLTSLAQVSPVLQILVTDPVLHRTRILIVNPSRVNHLLFGRSPEGILLRPTVGDLSQRGVLRGLGIERRWRTGMYFYSHRMVSLYENSMRLQRVHASNVITSHLRKRTTDSLNALYSTRVIPDAISSSIYLSISQTLMPVIRKLRWSLQKDQLSRLMRDASGFGKIGGVAAWIEAKGPGKIQEGERARLAVCPSTKKIVRFYEGLSHV